jgi:hypothetical protein
LTNEGLHRNPKMSIRLTLGRRQTCIRAARHGRIRGWPAFDIKISHLRLSKRHSRRTSVLSQTKNAAQEWFPARHFYNQQGQRLT